MGKINMNLVQFLRNRETGRSKRLRSCPLRQFRLSSMVQSLDVLRTHVFLGFTRCSNFVLSYTSDTQGLDDGNFDLATSYRLHIWLFRPGVALRLIQTVKLFTGYHALPPDMLIQIYQSHGSDDIIIRGREYQKSCAELARQNFITILALPDVALACTECRTGKSACPRHCTSLTIWYHSVHPYPFVHPALQLALPGRLLINTGESLLSLQYIHTSKRSTAKRAFSGVASHKMSSRSTVRVTPDDIAYSLSADGLRSVHYHLNVLEDSPSTKKEVFIEIVEDKFELEVYLEHLCLPVCRKSLLEYTCFNDYDARVISVESPETVFFLLSTFIECVPCTKFDFKQKNAFSKEMRAIRARLCLTIAWNVEDASYVVLKTSLEQTPGSFFHLKDPENRCVTNAMELISSRTAELAINRLPLVHGLTNIACLRGKSVSVLDDFSRLIRIVS